MKLFKLLTISTFILCFSFAGFAQFDKQNQNENNEKINDQELKEFASMQAKIQNINREGQQIMAKLIKENNMSVERYQEISRAKKGGSKPEMSSEEASNYEKASSAVQEQSAKMQKKMDEGFENSSLSKQRYIQINKQVSKDPDLQKKLKEMQK